MNCPKCGNELTKIDTPPNTGFVLITYKCRSCQWEFDTHITQLEMFMILMERFDKIERMLKEIKPNCDLPNCGVTFVGRFDD